MARWCSFAVTDSYGENRVRARTAMTDAGWQQFDPAADSGGRDSWEKEQSAQESARCDAPQAEIDPEAPATDTGVIVLVHAHRVITGANEPAYVVAVTQTRVVLRGPDRLWRVDVTSGGG